MILNRAKRQYKTKVLLVVALETHFVELFRLAQKLIQTRNFQPIFYFTGKVSSKQIGLCENDGIHWINFQGQISRSKNRDSQNFDDWGHALIMRFWRASRPRLMPFLRNSLISFLRQVIFEQELKKSLRFHKDLLKEFDIGLLVFAEENVGYAKTAGVLIALGKQNRIPSIVFPYTIANALEPAEAYINIPEHYLNFNRRNHFFGKLYPKWVYKHKAIQLLRLPAHMIGPIEKYGLAPPDPWILNSGQADAIAVESKFMKDYYVREGIPLSRLVETGALYDDVIAKARYQAEVLKGELYAELNLDPGKPLILCALPPSQFPRDECEFSDYAELWQFWLTSLDSIKEYNVVLSLHPRMKDEEANKIKHAAGRLSISTWETAKLVALCDIFIASVSATIRWAIASAKPVVNYDVYRYRYTDYQGERGVLTIETRGEFLHQLKKLTEDVGYYRKILSFQTKSAPYWGNLDGNAWSRILSLITNVSYNLH